VIGAHVIVGQAIQFAQLQNGQTYRSATGENLKISTGCVRRPFNVRVGRGAMSTTWALTLSACASRCSTVRLRVIGSTLHSSRAPVTWHLAVALAPSCARRYLYGIYVNDARLRETEGANNIPAARALIHKVGSRLEALFSGTCLYSLSPPQPPKRLEHLLRRLLPPNRPPW